MAKKAKSKVVRRNKSTKDKKRKKTRNKKPPVSWKRVLFLFAIILFIGIVGYVFLCSDLVKINIIEIIGIEKIDEKRILQIAETSMSGEIIGCVAKDNYFFVNTKDITQEISTDKRIKDVTISKKFPQTMIIDIVEYDVVPIWCIGSMNGDCFIVEGGYIKESVTFDSDVVMQNRYFVVVDESRSDVQTGEQVIVEENLDKIEFLGEELKYALSVGINQPYVTLSRGSHEVKFMTDEGWYILVDITQEADEIVDVAKLFFSKVNLPSRRNDLAYLDMRFPERIFYKMKDGVEQIEEVVEEPDASNQVEIDDDKNED
ncbi:MAG: FtsQ-type POTRA domain-containing protein [Patescibacteria group bacterium]|nr:FtsQ-type POTRA domain-containing protein [Patescibacteria group bacterium]